MGDYDPSGFDIERDLREKLQRLTGDQASITWNRLGVNRDDFKRFNLVPLEPKWTDARSQKFLTRYGDQCAEIDAIPSSELRKRVETAIKKHIPKKEWEELADIENYERDMLAVVSAFLP